MSGKTGRRPTGRKPAGSTRTNAKTKGAFGRQAPENVRTEVERNVDRSGSKRRPAPTVRGAGG
jgi:hypothetical protein